MAVKVTGQFAPAGDFSIVDGADVSGHITGSNVSASGQLEAGSLGTNLASIISGSTPFNAAAVSGSLGANASLIRSLTATGISGSTPFDASDVSGSWRGELSSSAMTVVGGGVSGSSTSTGSFDAGYFDKKVGIGTASPGNALTVTGGVEIVGNAEFLGSGEGLYHINNNGISIWNINARLNNRGTYQKIHTTREHGLVGAQFQPFCSRSCHQEGGCTKYRFEIFFK